MKQLKAFATLATLATLAEAKNYLGEKEYTTWKSWKAAVKKANPAAWIEGDEDIAQAMVGPKPYKRGETKAIGEHRLVCMSGVTGNNNDEDEADDDA